MFSITAKTSDVFYHRQNLRCFPSPQKPPMFSITAKTSDVFHHRHNFLCFPSPPKLPVFSITAKTSCVSKTSDVFNVVSVREEGVGGVAVHSVAEHQPRRAQGVGFVGQRGVRVQVGVV